MKPLSYIVKDSFITVFVDGKPISINNENENYSAVINAIKNQKWDIIPDLMSKKKAIVSAFSKDGSDVRIEDDKIFYKNKEVHGSLIRRVLSMLKNGFDVSRHVLFLENLMQNPSSTSINELWDFMEKNDLPISEDGCLLAYKKVRQNFKDIYSGTMDNSPGKFVEMPRNEVDDDRNNECSHGLHFCSYGYLNHYGSRDSSKVVMVKINPKDVVSFPRDYDLAKGRCAKYFVVEEIEGWEDKDVLTQDYVCEQERKRDLATENLPNDDTSWAWPFSTKSSPLEQKIDDQYNSIATVPNGAGVHPHKYFGYTERDLYLKTNQQLVDIYNQNIDPYFGSELSKFRDKRTGVERIKKLAKDLNAIII